MLLGGSVSPWRSGVEEGRSPLGRFRKPEPCFPRTYATWDAKKDENRFESMKFRLTPSPPQSLGGGCLRRPLKHSPYLLPPLERRRMVAPPQSHHTIVPVHPPSHLNQQQTKSLHPRRPLRPLQAQPLDRTDDIIGQQRDLEPRRVDSQPRARHLSATQFILHLVVRGLDRPGFLPMPI